MRLDFAIALDAINSFFVSEEIANAHDGFGLMLAESQEQVAPD